MKHTGERGPIWSITLFGHTFGRVPPEPTPLEEATSEYVLTQRALLRAHEKAEDANAEVSKLTDRLRRLGDDITMLREPQP